MIDLHTHILPRLDDGAKDFSEALSLAELALEGGVDTLVATPHSNQVGRFENYATGTLGQIFQLFQRALREENIPLQVYLGMEIYASSDVGEKIGQGKLIPLNQSRYYLVEFPFDQEPEIIGDTLDQIFSAGGVPLIAHPERYFCVQEYPVLVYGWIQMGCLTQINKGSLFERFGRHAARTAELLLQHHLVTCVASDAHSLYQRTTYMEDIREYLSDHLGDEAAYRLLTERPGKILRNRPISPHGMRPEGKRRIFF